MPYYKNFINFLFGISTLRVFCNIKLPSVWHDYIDRVLRSNALWQIYTSRKVFNIARNDSARLNRSATRIHWCALVNASPVQRRAAPRASARWMCRPSRHGTRVLSGASARSESGCIPEDKLSSRSSDFATSRCIRKRASLPMPVTMQRVPVMSETERILNRVDHPVDIFEVPTYVRTIYLLIHPPVYRLMPCVALALARSAECIWRIREYHPLCDKIYSYI